MINLKNDYSYIACQEILDSLYEKKDNCYNGYGMDFETDNLKQKMQSFFSIPIDMHLLITGTSTNKTIISHILKPFEAVISVETGHINVHETGAIENNGNKILTVKGINGKITPCEIINVCNLHIDEHMVKPRLVYISNSTEIGTIYTKDELKNIYKVCKENNLFLFLDGARLGTALTCEKNDLTLDIIAKNTDVFYLGGTKNGALFGEMVIFSNLLISENFRYSMKQNGAMLAKSFISTIMFNCLFTNNLYFNLASHTNEMASYLKDELIKLNYHLAYPFITNQIFIRIPLKELKTWENLASFEIWEKELDYYIIRLVTSFHTAKKEIEKFISDLKTTLLK